MAESATFDGIHESDNVDGRLPDMAGEAGRVARIKKPLALAAPPAVIGQVDGDRGKASRKQVGTMLAQRPLAAPSVAMNEKNQRRDFLNISPNLN